MRLFTPSDGPAWLPRFADSIISAFKSIMDAPFKLWRAATADLPAAADYTGGLAWDMTAAIVTWSNGSAWVQPSLSTHTHTLSGDVTGTVTGDVALATVNANTGTWGSATQAPQITLDAKGRATAAANVTITPAFSSITGKPTTLAGYGITDAQGLNANLTAIAGLTTASDKMIYWTGAGTAALLAVSATNRTALSNLSNTNSGDQTITLTGDATGSGTGSFAVTVAKINGVSLAGLATGILKNTTTTGAPSIAVAADFPTLNQSTTGSAATLTTSRNFSIAGGGITAAAVGFNGSAAVALSASVDPGHITLARMADMATASLIGRNTAGTGAPEVLSAATSRSLLGLVIGTNVQAWDADLDAVASSGLAAAWQSWTPTWTNLTVGNGTVTAKYVQVGKLVFCRLLIVFGSTTSVSGLILFSLPASRASYGGTIAALMGFARFWDTSASLNLEGVVSMSGATAAPAYYGASGSAMTTSGTSATLPFTWATGDEITMQFWYEAA